MSTYIGGIVKSISVTEGDFVKKGKVVMQLQHPDLVKLQEDYLVAKSNIEYLEKDYLRQKELHSHQASSGKAFQEAEAKYHSEKGRLASLISQLSMLSISTESLNKGIIQNVISIKSPIDGYIGHLHASMGAYVESNKSLFEVINNSNVHVRLDIFEKDLPKLKNGQPVTITLPNGSDESIEAIIFSIGKSMNTETNTLEVLAKIKGDKKEGLIPGVFVNAVINLSSRTANSLPEGAVIRVGEKQYIFIADDMVWQESKDSLDAHAGETTVDSMKTESVDYMEELGPPLIYRMIEVKTGWL